MITRDHKFLIFSISDFRSIIVNFGFVIVIKLIWVLFWISRISSLVPIGDKERDNKSYRLLSIGFLFFSPMFSKFELLFNSLLKFQFCTNSTFLLRCDFISPTSLVHRFVLNYWHVEVADCVLLTITGFFFTELIIKKLWNKIENEKKKTIA